MLTTKTRKNIRMRKKLNKFLGLEYRKIIPKEWNSGLNTPFDPIASELAEKERITIVTIDGRKIDNLAERLNGEKFIGTVIS